MHMPNISRYFVDQARKERLPLEVYKGLVDQLFGTPASFAAGVVCSLLGAGMSYAHSRQPIFLACLAAIALVSVFRCAIMVAYCIDRRARRRSRTALRLRQVVMWEALYGLVGSWAFMLTMGVTTAISIVLRDWPCITACGLVLIGSAGAMAGRNSGRMRIVRGQLACGLGPSAFVFLTSGDWFLQGIGLMFLMCAASTLEIANRFATKLKDLLVKGFAVEKLMVEIRAQKAINETALDSMSDGLCTFDGRGRVTVMNANFSAMFGDLPRDGRTPAADLFGMVAERIYLSADRKRDMLDRVLAMLGGDGVAQVTNGIRDYEFTAGPMKGEAGTVVTARDVTEANANKRRIENLAHYDQLTGLPNRYTFAEALDGVLAGMAGDVTLFGIDLDKFKDVNDNLGHHMGDKLLQDVAKRMRENLRPGDLVARLGGDEFAVMLCPDHPVDSQEVAKRLLDHVSVPYLIDGHTLDIGASIGIASATADCRDGDELLRRADLAMYAAKKAGRGIMKAYTADMDEAERQRQALKRDLEGANERGELYLEYQPIVDARVGTVVACEALLRWNHPVRGRVGPDKFIPIAEESGLIVQIGGWVLRNACQEAATWEGDVKVAVNVAPAQLSRGDVAEDIRMALRTSGLDPSRLEVEITESENVANDDRTKASIKAIKATGVRLALDDFGKEYSTLSRLNALPIDKIKVDMAFVKAMDSDPTAKAIIRAVAGIAADTGKSVVCEGVQTQGQVDTLLSLGTHLMQGWHYSKSLPSAEIRALLAGPQFKARPVLRVVS